jgi:hypothetical protein
MKLFIIALLVSVSSFGLSLEGTWNGECVEDPDGYMQDNISFKGNGYEILSYHHADEACDTANVKIESKGSFVIPEGENGRVTNIDFTSQSTFITPLTKGMAFSMNLISLCGLKNWKANQKNEVSGKTCQEDVVPKVGETIYNIHSVENDGTLYTGKRTSEKNGKTPETRPTELDTDMPFKKG